MRYDVDVLAWHLMDLGYRASRLPRNGHALPVTRHDGARLGTMIPGVGLALRDDLKSVGIRGPLPWIMERSLLQKLRDLLRSERGAITTYEQLQDVVIARKSGPLMSHWSKTHSQVANLWFHNFLSAGTPQGSAYTAIPGGAALDRTSAGALNGVFVDPSSSDKAFLVSFGMGSQSAQLQSVILIDLLVAAGSISTTINTAQTVNTTALTRYTTGDGVMMFFEVTTALGTGASNVTANKYTNQAGTTLQTTPATAIVVSSTVQRIPFSVVVPFFPLASGDWGVRSVQEVTMSAAMAGSGVLACILCKPLMWFPQIPSDSYGVRDLMSNIEGCTEIAKTSGDVMGCLSTIIQSSLGGSLTVTGHCEIAVGS